MRLLPLLLLLVAGTAVSDTLRDDFDAKYKAWNEVCIVLMPGECTGVRAPKVVYEEMRSGLRGYYLGYGTVFVNSKLKGDMRMATLIHETIHYVHVQTGKNVVPGGAEEICWSESEAFTLTDFWWRSIGKPERQRGSNWWKVYWHCEPYYDPNFDIWDWFKRGLKRYGNEIFSS